MKRYFPVIVPTFLFLFAACSNAERGHSSGQATSAKEVATTDSANDAVTEPDETLALNAPERKIIRTAAMRCRVTDVYSATAQAEHLVTAIGGQIAESNLENEMNAVTSLPYTKDSLRQVQSYTTTAHLLLRIPVQRLDSALTVIAAGTAFLNTRKLALDDVTFQYLTNQLKNRATDGDAAKKAASLAHKTSDVITAAEYEDDRNGRNIDRRIANMGLLDQVRYATVQIDFYQPERMDQLIVPNMSVMMKPSFGQQIALALHNSWEGLKIFVIVLISIWPIVAFAAIVVVFIRHRKAKRLRPSIAR